jgi:hypothetical protein
VADPKFTEEQAEAVELCRRSHKIAPFCFFNGNTFATIIRLALREVPESTTIRKHLFLTIAAHMVAGTATPEEEFEFKKILQKMA